MALLSYLFVATILVAQAPNPGGNAQPEAENEAPAGLAADEVEKFAKYTSKGEAKLEAGGTGKPTNSTLTRELMYTAKESKSNQIHKYVIEDGEGIYLADTRPDKCFVQNAESGKIVDEFAETLTCNKHFGGEAYRKVIDAMLTKYTALFRKEVDTKKGILRIYPAAGFENIEYKSQATMNIELKANNRTYTLIATMDASGKIQATHTFIVNDPNVDKPGEGYRIVRVMMDFSRETQKFIEPLVRETVNKTDIRNGERKEHIASKSDILSRF